MYLLGTLSYFQQPPSSQNPLLTPSNKTYALNWTLTASLIQNVFTSPIGQSTLQIREAYNPLDATQRVQACSMPLFQGDYEENPLYLYGKGMFFPAYKRGAMELNILSVLNFDGSKYLKQLQDGGDFPSADQRKIFGNATSLKDCAFVYYYQQTEVVREIAPNVYSPDSGINESIPINSTHEIVAGLQGEIISQNCGIQIMINGSIRNIAQLQMKANYYAIVAIVVEIAGTISGIKLVLEWTTPARLKTLSRLSFVLQGLFDLILLIYYYQFAIQLSVRAMFLVAFIMTIACFNVDMTMFIKIAMFHAQNQPANQNRCCRVLFYFIFVATIVLIYFLTDIPQWGIFVLVMIISSHWFIQSVYSIIQDIPRKFITGDYLLIQTLTKYAPVAYFYGYADNFAKYQVLSWQPYVIGIWFGFQVLVIYAQWLFGGRFGCKKTITAIDKNIIRFIPEYYLESFHPQKYLAEAAEQGIQLQLYLENNNVCFPVPTNVDRLCMNPAHTHSLMKAIDLSRFDDRKLTFLHKNVDGQKCFILITHEQAAITIQCSICLDAIDLTQLDDPKMLQISSSSQEPPPPLGDQKMNITKCHHVFHDSCVRKWVAENPICPVCRTSLLD